MPTEIALRCRCGVVAGVADDVSASSCFRFVCYCSDCQAFARLLERTDVLDAAGGTEIVQMPPARIHIRAGLDALRCMQLSANVLRWYAECCRTPIANTAATPSFPLAGVIHSFLALPAGSARDDVLGPPLCRLFERSATGPLPPNAPKPPSLRTFARRSAMLLRWSLRGLARPTPFFEPDTKAPRAVPRVISANERFGL